MCDQDHTKQLTTNESSIELYKLYETNDINDNNEYILLNPLTQW